MARKTGRVNEKVLPFCNSLSTQILPPCSITSSLLIYKPSTIPAEKGSESYGITFVFARIQQRTLPMPGFGWECLLSGEGRDYPSFLLRIQARSYLLSFAGRKLLPTPRTPHPLTINPHHLIRRDRITAGSTGGIQLREDFLQTGFGNAGHILTASTESSAPTNPSLSASPA